MTTAWEYGGLKNQNHDSAITYAIKYARCWRQGSILDLDLVNEENNLWRFDQKSSVIVIAIVKTWSQNFKTTS